MLLSRGATTFSKLGVQFLGLGYYTEQMRMVYSVSCTAACSYVKSWGGPSKLGEGVRTPQAPPPSGCALASEEVILELVRAKFIPDGLESFQLGKADL